MEMFSVPEFKILISTSGNLELRKLYRFSKPTGQNYRISGDQRTGKKYVDSPTREKLNV